METRERGRRLSRIVTGTIGLVAVVAASALGLHDWADTLATKAAATGSTITSEDSQGSTDSGGPAESQTDREDDSGYSAPDSNSGSSAIPPVSSGVGTTSHATSSGS